MMDALAQAISVVSVVVMIGLVGLLVWLNRREK